MNPKIISFALSAHANVNQLYDGHPYGVHLAMTVHFAYKYIHLIPEANNCRGMVIDACWLHDVIEDCRVTYNDLRQLTGNPQLADIVYAVSTEKGRNRKECANDKYYEVIRETDFATFVKLCDRMANVRYSKSLRSYMWDTYVSEHQEFIQKIFPVDDISKYMYTEIINDLNKLINDPTVF